MSDKIHIETLPVTSEYLRIKRHADERGEIAFVEDGQPIHHLAYIVFAARPGQYRGGHWHARRTERFYVIEGRLRIRCVDLDSGERFDVEVLGGQKLVIRPRLAHRFEALEETKTLEYYEGVYDRADDHPYGAGAGEAWD